jgi:superfamily II DNA/RNA helicase
MVFFSSCNSVKYHGELLNYIDVPVKDIHGKQKQQRRTTTFLEFCKARSVHKVPVSPQFLPFILVTVFLTAVYR